MILLPTFGYYNVDGTSTFSGLEIESSYALIESNLIASANYTHLFEYQKEDGAKLQDVQKTHSMFH